jgi:hypothetical protein
MERAIIGKVATCLRGVGGLVDARRPCPSPGWHGVLVEGLGEGRSRTCITTDMHAKFHCACTSVQLTLNLDTLGKHVSIIKR